MDRRAWLILLGLSLGPAVSNGFARFAYGLILPAMQHDLSWNYTTAGWLNTANAIGYLAGALIALAFVQRIGAGKMFIGGMVVTAVALICSGLTKALWLLSLWRVLAGIGSAPVFIAGGALASTLYRNDASKNALAIAVYFGGGGFGMLLTAVVIPPILEFGGSASWPKTWILLGIASAIAVVPCVVAVAAVEPENPRAGGEARKDRLALDRIAPALIGYFLFGLGYFIYMTFLVAWIRAQGNGVWLVVMTWSLLGVMVMLSPFLWRPVLSASAGGMAMALALTLTGLGSLVPLLLSGNAGMLLSAMLFGLSLFMVPTAVTNFSKKNYPQEKWGAAVALFTTIFAIGQIIGPGTAGMVADYTSSLAPGIAAGGVALLLGALISLLQKPLKK